MTPEVKEEVDLARKYLLESALGEDTKDNLRRLLTSAAAATNGHENKLQALTEVVLELAIHETRQAVRHPVQLSIAVRDEMGRHIATCPWRSAAANMPKWVLHAYAFRWQLTVAISVATFSPYAPDIARVIFTAMHH